jgi:hypothetical protein
MNIELINAYFSFISYFFHDEKVNKKSRQNNASSRPVASLEFQQK